MNEDDNEDDNEDENDNDNEDDNEKLSTPSGALLLTQRRNGNCDPQRVQNDIESFF